MPGAAEAFEEYAKRAPAGNAAPKQSAAEVFEARAAGKLPDEALSGQETDPWTYDPETGAEIPLSTMNARLQGAASGVDLAASAVLNTPKSIVGLGAELAARGGRVFDSSVDPEGFRQRVESHLPGYQISPATAKLNSALMEAPTTAVQEFLERHPALHAIATTARLGSEVLGTAAAAKGIASGFRGKIPPMLERPPSAPTETIPPKVDAAAKPELSATGSPRHAPFEIPDDPKQYRDIAPVSNAGPIPDVEQSKRAGVLSRIGFAPEDDIRKSAITGSEKDAATEYQQSKLDGPAGDFMSNQFKHERQVINRFVDQIQESTGGSRGLDQSALHSRGNAIVEPLDSLKEYFDSKTKALYTQAHETGVTTAVQPKGLGNIVSDESTFLGTVEGEALLRGVKARMKALKIADAEGNIVSTDAKQLELLRQYVGDQWTPRTNRLIKSMKDAIDDDVFSAAEDSLYKESRAMRELRANTLDNPNGIAKVMDSDGPGGINRKVDIEKIPDTITKLGVNQFEHVVKTLQSVPEEIQPQAAQAIAEIRSQFANRIAEAGNSTKENWNAKAVTKYMAANSKRMEMVFSPEEMAQFRDLNDAGHILQKPTNYPGAEVQRQNLLRSGVISALPKAAAATGATAGGVFAGPFGAGAGAAIGEALGAKKAASMSASADLAASKQRMAKLSDLLKVKPKK